MIDPSEESFFASKSMVLIALSTATMFLLLLIYIAVRVFFHEDILQVVLGAMGMETAKTTTGVARNVIEDGAARKDYAAAQDPPKTAAF